MTKFIMGLLLGLILGIGGTAVFLISAGGGDYLVVTSPRVRELETSLKQADQEREWLRGQLRDSNQILVKLESRFVALATRFGDLGSQAATLLAAPVVKEASAVKDVAKTAASVAAEATPPDPETAAGATTEPAPTEPAATQTLAAAATPTPAAVEATADAAGGDGDAAPSPAGG
ncbi:MAG: hypothetical protein P8R42_30215 [Candidatus Binatia bacterium]|nr:hypothetical protein [Candidatus Binatia bacterium]